MVKSPRWLWLLVAVPVLLAVVADYSLSFTARKHVAKLNYVRQTIKGTRVPCEGTFDAGVIVVYQLEKRGREYTGRMCRSVEGWRWYPSTNEVASVRVD